MTEWGRGRGVGRGVPRNEKDFVCWRCWTRVAIIMINIASWAGVRQEAAGSRQLA